MKTCSLPQKIAKLLHQKPQEDLITCIKKNECTAVLVFKISKRLEKN